MLLKINKVIINTLFICSLFITSLFTSCNTSTNVDLIIYNAKIYTVDSLFTIAEAMAVKGGKIEATGTSKEIATRYESANKINAEGKTIYPGFIDAHAHFYRYGLGLQTTDLTGTTSWKTY